MITYRWLSKPVIWYYQMRNEGYETHSCQKWLLASSNQTDCSIRIKSFFLFITSDFIKKKKKMNRKNSSISWIRACMPKVNKLLSKMQCTVKWRKSCKLLQKLMEGVGTNSYFWTSLKSLYSRCEEKPLSFRVVWFSFHLPTPPCTQQTCEWHSICSILCRLINWMINIKALDNTNNNLYSLSCPLANKMAG